MFFLDFTSQYSLLSAYRRFLYGERLVSEIKLHAFFYSNSQLDLSQELSYLRNSFGLKDSSNCIFNSSKCNNISSSLEFILSQVDTTEELSLARSNLYKQFPFYVDALMAISISKVASLTVKESQIMMSKRFIYFLLSFFPERPDLIVQFLSNFPLIFDARTFSYSLLTSSIYYSNTNCSLSYLQSLWASGSYSILFSLYISYLVASRAFPLSDYVMRCYSILGLGELSADLLVPVYIRMGFSFPLISISNLLFLLLGLEYLKQPLIDRLVADFRSRSLYDLPNPCVPLPAPRFLEVFEKPLIAIVSSDLRMHPVGRFWLPVAKILSQSFNLVHISSNPYGSDEFTEEFRSLSFAFHTLLVTDNPATLLSEIKPHLLLDLGGHTADNRPGVLNHRFAPVQATYLGFYGPSYGLHCDWWILDNAIARRVKDSYPGSEPIWALPGPSLCFDPIAHGLPPLDKLRYTEPNHPCIGSFNHTRKLTDTCINRFASVLNNIPTSTLLFRSHSFYDHGVRRWFLQRFIDASVDPAQLQPIPYAASGAESLLDYGRIHLHLDTYPVCGTTTTLDSMAMGIPVLTCPNHLYAGAISAALIEQAGFSDWICDDPADLSALAAHLAAAYRTAASRRALAQQVRSSPVCNTQAMPKMFATQLKEMLKASSLSYTS